MTIPAGCHDLVGAPNYPHIVTVNEDGSPQSTVVWVARDGDDVLFNTYARFRKAHNMTRDPRVALSVHDADDPYRYLELRGVAEIRPTPSEDLIDSLAKAYVAAGRRAEAIAMYERSFELNRSNVGALRALDALRRWSPRE